MKLTGALTDYHWEGEAQRGPSAAHMPEMNGWKTLAGCRFVEMNGLEEIRGFCRCGWRTALRYPTSYMA